MDKKQTLPRLLIIMSLIFLIVSIGDAASFHLCNAKEDVQKDAMQMTISQAGEGDIKPPVIISVSQEPSYPQPNEKVIIVARAFLSSFSFRFL